MKIVVNYLKEAEELFNEGKIDFVDYFKLYSINEELTPIDWCVEHRPVMFHGVIGELIAFGDKNLIAGTNIEKTKEVLEKTKSPYLSGHISSQKMEQTKEETLEAIKENISEYKKVFNKEIALENVPYRNYFDHCVYLLEPELISKIVYENDCMFLFDISHARSAAAYLNIPFDEYVSKLPMDKVVEIHLAGMTEKSDGTRVDCHGKLQEEDYQFLREALKKYPTLQYITLEYGPYYSERMEELMGEDIKLLPFVTFDSINEKAKEEVYEQLIRIKEIIDNN